MKFSGLHALRLQIIFIEEKDNIIAYCPALDLSTCGSDIEEAQRMFQEAAEAFFESCIERQVLDEVLEDLGWQRVDEDNQNPWIPPHVINATKEVSISF